MYYSYRSSDCKVFVLNKYQFCSTQLSPDWTYTTNLFGESAVLMAFSMGLRIIRCQPIFTVYPRLDSRSNKIRSCGRTQSATVWPWRALMKTPGKFGWRSPHVQLLSGQKGTGDIPECLQMAYYLCTTWQKPCQIVLPKFLDTAPLVNWWSSLRSMMRLFKQQA